MLDRCFFVTWSVIDYYARNIAEAVALPSQFAHLAPNVRDSFEHNAFGRTVDLEDRTTTLTGTWWRYLKVPQKQFEQLQAATLTDLVLTGEALFDA